jgi:hypothetical protein
MLNSEIKYEHYKEENKNSLLNLLSQMWVNLSASERKDLFEWRYEKNPHQDRPYVYLALDGDRVAGFRAFVVQVFLLRGKEYFVYSPADAIVDINYRRRGIFSKLNNAFLNDLLIHKKEHAIILNLTSNAYSTKGYLKQQWQATNGMKFFYYNFSSIALVYRHFGKANELPVVINRKKIDIEITTTFYYKELDDFNKHIRNPEVWSPVRDELFYKWRYGHEIDFYEVVYARSSGVLQAYLILRKMTDKQYTIEEYGSVSKEAFKNIVSLSMRFLQIPLLRCWAMSDNNKMMVKSAGFYAEPINLMKMMGKVRLPILVRPISLNPMTSDFIIDGQDIRKIENWQVQLTDRH